MLLLKIIEVVCAVGLLFLRLAAQLKTLWFLWSVILHLVEGVKCVGDLSVRFLWFNIVQ